MRHAKKFNIGGREVTYTDIMRICDCAPKTAYKRIKLYLAKRLSAEEVFELQFHGEVFQVGDWAGTVKQLAEKIGVKKSTLHARLKKFQAGTMTARNVMAPVGSLYYRVEKIPMVKSATTLKRSKSNIPGRLRIQDIPVGPFDNI